MQTKFVYSFRRIFCRQSLSAELVYRACLHDLGMQTRFVYVLKSLSKAFCKVVCGNADKVCLEITSFSLFSDSIINFVSSHRVRRLSLESSHQFESSCCLARTDLHSRKCVFVCARVGFKTCTRAIHVVRACERACERASQCASERACSEQRASVQRAASERAASSERQRACIAPLLFPSLGTKLGCVYIQLHAESA